MSLIHISAWPWDYLDQKISSPCHSFLHFQHFPFFSSGILLKISSLLCYSHMRLALFLFPRAGQTPGVRDAPHLVVTSCVNASVSGCCRQPITHQAVGLTRSLWSPAQQAYHTLEPLSWGHSSCYAVTRQEMLSGL